MDLFDYEDLKFRRANNIFEKGDKVVFLEKYHSAMICEYGDGCEDVGEVRHASTKEIAQGFRDE